jgi:HK97 family phage major capsid protein
MTPPRTQAARSTPCITCSPQPDSATGYTANGNITASATGAPAAGAIYADLSTVAGVYESGDYFDEGDTIIIAHPTFKKIVRNEKDDQGRPIFQEGGAGIPGGGTNRSADMIFGYPVHWSLGAKTAATPTPTPTGNPRYLLLGVRSGPSRCSSTAATGWQR